MKTHTVATVPATDTTSLAEHLQQLRTEVDAYLLDARTIAWLVAIDPHRGSGYFTPAARRQADESIRRERATRIQADGKTAGLNVSPEVNDAGLKTGHVAAPGNIKVIAVEVEITAALRHNLRRTVTYLATWGICSRWPITDNDTTSELAHHVSRLLPYIQSQQLLTGIARDLGQVVETAGDIAYGEARTPLEGELCPHCGRPTLVMLWARKHTGIEVDQARCDRDPRTGHYQPCICADPLCDCKRRPVTYRHTWQRVAGSGPHTTDFLTRRLAQLRDLKKGTRA